MSLGTFVPNSLHFACWSSGIACCQQWVSAAAVLIWARSTSTVSVRPFVCPSQCCVVIPRWALTNRTLSTTKTDRRRRQTGAVLPRRRHRWLRPAAESRRGQAFRGVALCVTGTSSSSNNTLSWRASSNNQRSAATVLTSSGNVPSTLLAHFRPEFQYRDSD